MGVLKDPRQERDTHTCVSIALLYSNLSGSRRKLTTGTTLARTAATTKSSTTAAATGTKTSGTDVLDALAGVAWAGLDGAPGGGIGRTNGRATTTTSATRRRRSTTSTSTSTATAGGDADRAVVERGRRAVLLLGEELLPPGRVAVEQAQHLLGLAVVGHLVLELAALLGEGAGAVVDPLVAVDLVAAVVVVGVGRSAGDGARGVAVVDASGGVGEDDGACGWAGGAMGAVGRGGDDGVNAVL